MKDARGRRRGRKGAPESFDVVTPTPNEAKLAEIARRQKLYFRVIVPCLALVLFGFLVPSPMPVRITVLAIASCLPPIAAMVGNGW